MRLSLLFIFLISLGGFAPAQTARQFFNHATAAAKKGDYAEALENYQIALGKNISARNEPKLHYNIGVCLFQLNQPAKAVAEFSKAIEQSGGNYQKAFYALGAAQRELKDSQAAKAAFTAAIRLGSDEAWFDLAMILIEEKEYDFAAAAFRAAIKNKSIAVAASHNNLGVILAINNDFAAAEKEFEISLNESNGGFVEAKNNLKFCRERRANNLQTKLIFINAEIRPN